MKMEKINNMKLEEIKYEELNFDDIIEQFNKLIDKFEQAKTAKSQIEAAYEIEDLNRRIQTSAELCSIRYSQNVNDIYYSKQQEVWDEKAPLLEVCSNRLNKAIVSSKFKGQLSKEFGTRFINSAELATKLFDEKIIPDMIEDNKLCSQYSKLIGSAKIKFRGNTYNLSQLGKFTSSTDRKTRQDASKASFKYFEKHLEEFDSIYDSMVKCRDSMAKKLGFKNFVEYRYLALERTDYTPEDVKNYRDAIYKYVVPVTKKMFKRQAKRLGIRGMKYFDYNLEFNSGNAKPIGNTEELTNKARKMYHEMSKETDEFFTFIYGLQSKQNMETKLTNHFPMIETAETTRFIESLPFRLTQEQAKVWEEMKEDMLSPYCMNRLIQGDVGSGKTVLALLSLLLAISNGYQGALMAPTEVLATQHYETVKDYSNRFHIDFAPILLVGSMTAKQKKEAYEKIEKGDLIKIFFSFCYYLIRFFYIIQNSTFFTKFIHFIQINFCINFAFFCINFVYYITFIINYSKLITFLNNPRFIA